MSVHARDVARRIRLIKAAGLGVQPEGECISCGMVYEVDAVKVDQSTTLHGSVKVSSGFVQCWTWKPTALSESLQRSSPVARDRTLY